MEILTVKDLSFKYPDRAEKAVDGVSFGVRRGDFVAVCGASGSGKTTLMRLMKPQLMPLGEMSGQVIYAGGRSDAGAVGYVMQRPEQQIVTDKVWHELAFGAENLGMPTDVMRRRVAETASYFGIEDWFERDVSSLSGGQKQLLCLASVMVTGPELLLLDEPTAQLDPIAAAEFISTVGRLNRELSLTVIIADHRLEDIIPRADKLLALDGGRLAAFGEPRALIEKLPADSELMQSMPTAARIFRGLGKTGECPLTVREGREFITGRYNDRVKKLKRAERERPSGKALELKDVFFRYKKDMPDVLRGLTLDVYENEIFCILGGNGSGKSTALSVISGILKPYAGTVRVFGKKLKDYKNQSLYRECLALLPQDVQTVFLHSAVRAELEECGMREDIPFGLEPLLDSHPYDLSGGQQQLAALAKVLGTRPRLLLLDEPTKGLDCAAKKQFARYLKELRDKGLTVVAVTHDVEFAAECADRCGMFFRGEIVSLGEAHSFFPENSFYTTAANRMTSGFYDEVITADEAAALCLENGERSGDVRI